MLEKQLQAKCLKYLKGFPGVWVLKTIVSNKAGVPDVIACIAGRFVSFEIKKPGGDATPLQKYNGEQIEKAGGVFHMVDNFESFKQIIHKLTGVNNVD